MRSSRRQTGMLVRVERRVVGQAHAQRRDLHARDHRPKRRRAAASRRAATRTGASPARSPGDRPARWRWRPAPRGAARAAALGERRPERDVSERRMAQQLVEAQQRLLELGAAPRRAVAAHRAAGASAGAAAVPSRARRAAAARRLRHARRAARSGRRGAAARRRAAEARARGQHHGAVDARLDALRFEPRRRRGRGVLQQAGGDAGGGAQHDRALDLRARRPRRPRPTARSRRRAAGTGSTRRVTWFWPTSVEVKVCSSRSSHSAVLSISCIAREISMSTSTRDSSISSRPPARSRLRRTARRAARRGPRRPACAASRRRSSRRAARCAAAP